MTTSNSRRPVTVTSLSITRAPGLPNGFRLEGFGPGVTIVWGPNGSGKSTTTRALHSLFHRQQSDDGVVAQAVLSHGDDSWTLSRNGRHASVKRNGLEQSRPSFAALTDQISERYVLALHDLLRSEDDDFAEYIAREMSGGYDIEAAALKTGFERMPSLHAPKRELHRTIQEHSRLMAEQSALAADQARLSELLADRDRVNEAGEQLAWLNDVRTTFEKRSHLAEAEAALAQFDEAMSNVRALDADMIAGWAKTEPGRRDRARTIDDRLDELHARRTAIGVDDIAEMRARLTAIETLIDDARSARQASIQSQQSLAVARDRSRALTSAISPLLPEPLQLAESVSLLGQYQAALARQADALELARAETVLAMHVPPPGNVPDRHQIRTRMELLTEWLAANAVEDAVIRKLRLLAVAAVAVIVALSAGLGYFEDERFYAVACVGVIVLVLAWRIGHARSAHSRRADVEATWYRAGFASPERWEISPVLDALDQASSELSHVVRAEQAESIWNAIRPQLEERAEREAIAAEHVTELEEQLGADIEVDQVALHQLATSLDASLQAGREVIRLKPEQVQSEEAWQAELRLLQESLAPLWAGAIPDIPTATGALAALNDRLGDAIQMQREIERLAAEQSDVVQPALRRIDEERAELLGRFANRPFDEIERLVADFESYARARDLVRNRRDAYDFDLSRLGEQFEIEEWSIERLERESTERREIVDRAQNTNEEIGGINARVESAKRSDAVATAFNRIDDARTALNATIDTRLKHAIGSLVIEEVRAVTQRANVPAVVERARSLFTAFANGQYDLRMVSGKRPSFAAWDNVQGAERALGELSSGTRVQLLIAVRLAFVEHLEQDATLPVIFDETLANADDERSDALIDTTLQIAASGRQVFYFTAQLDEVQKWRERASARGNDIAVLDLAAARGESNRMRPPDVTLEPFVPHSIPDPTGYDRAAYRTALAVPAIDIWASDPGPAHLWYLIEDLDFLHRLISEHGVTTWGQVRQYDVGKSAPALGIDAAEYARLAATAEALHECMRALRQGRGRPVTDADLAASGGMTETFDQACRDLLALVDFDGDRFLAQLEKGAINRFRSDRIARFRNHFESNGQLATGIPLAASAVRARVATACNSALTSGEIALATIDRLLEDAFSPVTTVADLARTTGVTAARLPSME